MRTIRRQTAPSDRLEAWHECRGPELRRLLTAVAAGELGLTRTAQQALLAAPVEHHVELVRTHTEGALRLLDDPRLYTAVGELAQRNRRATWRRLARHPELAARIAGYGWALLGGLVPGADPERAWSPMGRWVLTTRSGWTTLRRLLPVPYRHAAALAELERRTLPAARALRVLAYLGGAAGIAEAETLLRLGEHHGGTWLRIRVRGALAELERLRPSAPPTPPPPQYPELLPREEFFDVDGITFRTEEQPR